MGLSVFEGLSTTSLLVVVPVALGFVLVSLWALVEVVRNILTQRGRFVVAVVLFPNSARRSHGVTPTHHSLFSAVRDHKPRPYLDLVLDSAFMSCLGVEPVYERLHCIPHSGLPPKHSAWLLCMLSPHFATLTPTSLQITSSLLSPHPAHYFGSGSQHCSTLPQISSF